MAYGKQSRKNEKAYMVSPYSYKVMLCKWQKSNQMQKLLFQKLTIKFKQKPLIVKVH